MDPITLIVAALVAGGSEAVKETASKAVKDAYDGLKHLIQRRFHGNEAGEVALAKHAEKPEVWEPALREELENSGAADDAELVRAAQALVEQVNSERVARGEQTIVVGGTVNVGRRGMIQAGRDVGGVHIGDS
jgi:hypothetical protein